MAGKYWRSSNETARNGFESNSPFDVKCDFMIQRVIIGRGTQDMLTRDLSRRLMAIRRNYHHGLLSKERAKASGNAVIEDEFETRLRVSRDRVQYIFRRKIELPPEERTRLERWRDGYIEDWERIIDDIRRAGGE